MTHGIINTKTRKTFLKYHKKCFYCGAKAKTIDHIIPCQVFAMTCEFEEDYRSCVRDRDNWRPACKSCNSKRRAHFMKEDLPMSLIATYSDNIDRYIDARNNVLEAQNGKCAICGKSIIPFNAVLLFKRKAKEHKLDAENCIVVCYNCDETE